MARVTVEDCLDHVDNRFELVLLATRRARQIARGAQPLVEWENDKPTVVALREVADALITTENVEETGQIPEEEADAELAALLREADEREADAGEAAGAAETGLPEEETRPPETAVDGTGADAGDEAGQDSGAAPDEGPERSEDA